MERRAFGKTGLEISRLVIGGGYVGGLLLHAGEAEKQALLNQALAAGINWIDTAPSYGNGVSETEIGRLLAEMGLRSKFTVSSKVRLDDDGLSDIEGQIRRSLEASLKRLRQEKLALLQLHNPMHQDGVSAAVVLGPGGVLDVFEKLQDEGLIGHGGFTAVGDTAICREVIASGRVASAQIYYNMLNPSAGRSVPAAWSSDDFHGLLQACAEHNVAAMNIRVFAAGVLASSERHGREIPMMPGATVAAEEKRAEQLYAVLGPAFDNWAATALRFSLSEPRLDCVILGLAELTHLKTALAAYERGPIADQTIAGLAEIWAASDY